MKTLVRIGIIMMIVFAMASCRQTVEYVQNGWEIKANPKTGMMSVQQKDLGLVMNEVQLNLKTENKLIPFPDWEIQKDKGKLKLITSVPKITNWTFTILETGVNIECSDPDGILTGIVPAGEKRIPARVASQDNGIMYTQMGFVSATDIYNLFDMNTDIMIQFPKEARLARKEVDREWMKVTFPVAEGEEISLIKEYYTNVVGLADNQITEFKPVFEPIPNRFSTAPTGWSSWYCYYMSPSQEDLVQETDALAKKLKPYGLEYVQLDAAYTRGDQANWLNWNKELYPNGGKWWFDRIIKNGLKPGLWLNIYGDNYTNPSMAEKYPEDFYFRDKKGKLNQACCSADTTVVRLDYTNPEVIEKHLKPLFETLVNDWGLAYLKDAGWGTWMDYYEDNRKNAFNPDMDSREVDRKAQEAVREVMGENNYITGCAMHEVGAGFNYFDGSRTGGDDYAQWTGKGHFSGGMQTFFNSLFGANYLNGICWWSDPDDVMVRDPLTMEEAKTIVSTISLSGQAYVISDFIADFSEKRLQNFLSSKYSIGWASKYPKLVKKLPDEKLDLYKKTMPAMPIHAMDLYPFKTKAQCCPKPSEYPRALDLKVNAVSGTYDVVALYNWSEKDSIETLALHEDLGLEMNKSYLAFDFWNKKLLNVLHDSIKETIPGHGTKAIIIREIIEIPQLIATSRHLTTAESLESLKWDSGKKTLLGVSKTVPGDSYSLYIYLPENMKVLKVDANAEDVKSEPVAGQLLKITFSGKNVPVEWSVVFQGV